MWQTWPSGAERRFLVCLAITVSLGASCQRSAGLLELSAAPSRLPETQRRETKVNAPVQPRRPLLSPTTLLPVSLPASPHTRWAGRRRPFRMQSPAKNSTPRFKAWGLLWPEQFSAPGEKASGSADSRNHLMNAKMFRMTHAADQEALPCC